MQLVPPKPMTDSGDPPRATSVHPLGPIDIAMRSVDSIIREMGYPGFETQMLVWLSGRVDADRLRGALGKLTEEFPQVVSRLSENENGAGKRACWKQLRNECPRLVEIQLEPGGEQQVLRFAETLLSTHHELEESPPLRFYLLHQAEGGDVFLMHYSHVLMDNSTPPLVLRHIDRLFAGAGRRSDTSNPGRLIARYLRRFSLADRRDAVAAAIDLHRRVFQGRAAVLSRRGERGREQPQLSIATRSLTADQTRLLQSNLAKISGVLSLSMGILASSFRAIDRLGDRQANTGCRLAAGIGLDLGLRSDGLPSFCNLMSVLPVSVRPEDLSDRGILVRNLCHQLRDCLERKIDLGVFRAVNGFRRRPRHIRWLVEHLLNYSYSLWYAYFGSLDTAGQEFCGVRINNVHYVGPTWSPIGISLLVNQYRRCLHFQATFDPQLVPEPLAHRFLDTILEDLTNGDGQETGI
jgi:hypothetical protein